MGTFLYRLSVFLGFVTIIVILIFGYLFFEPFMTETEEVIKVINIERWGNESGKYFIFTDDEVFLNANDYYNNKHNADELMKQFRKGYTYRVKVVGIYIPFIPRFRNILNIIDYSTNEYYPEN
jgi:hypothetical protein